jgi:hypothetical protein
MASLRLAKCTSVTASNAFAELFTGIAFRSPHWSLACMASCACSVRAAFHPAAFEASLARHKEEAAAAAQLLAADIRDGRYDPARPDFNQGQLDPAAEAAGEAAGAGGGGRCGSSGLQQMQIKVSSSVRLVPSACLQPACSRLQ